MGYLKKSQDFHILKKSQLTNKKQTLQGFIFRFTAQNIPILLQKKFDFLSVYIFFSFDQKVDLFQISSLENRLEFLEIKLFASKTENFFSQML